MRTLLKNAVDSNVALGLVLTLLSRLTLNIDSEGVVVDIWEGLHGRSRPRTRRIGSATEEDAASKKDPDGFAMSGS